MRLFGMLAILLGLAGCAPSGTPQTREDALVDAVNDALPWDTQLGDALFMDTFEDTNVSPSDAGVSDVQMDILPDVPEDTFVGPQDELDLSLVTWFDDDISGWPITDELSVGFPNGRDIEFRHNQRHGWMPHRNLGADSSGNDVIVNANAWVFAKWMAFGTGALSSTSARGRLSNGRMRWTAPT